MLLLLNNTIQSSKQLINTFTGGGVSQEEIVVLHPDDNWQDYTGIDTVVLALQEPDEQSRNLIKDTRVTYPESPMIVLSVEKKATYDLKKQYDFAGLCIPLEEISPATIKVLLLCAAELHRKHTRMQDFIRMFRENPMPMFVYDMNTLQFLNVNDAAIQKYGYSYEEFTSITIKDIRPPEDVPKLIEILPKQAQKGFHDFGVWTHRKKGGEDFYVRVMAYKTEQNGRLTQVIIAEDVDKQIKTEKEKKDLLSLLEANQEHIETILSSVNEMIWARDAKDHTIIYTNKACYNIYGRTPEELIGTKGSLDRDVIHPEDMHTLEAQIEMLYKSGRADAEYRIKDTFGNIKHVLSKAVLSYRPDGSPAVVTGTTSDITELKEAQLLLEEKSRELKMVMDSITDGFLLLDTDWHFTYVNKAFEKIYGINKEDIIYKRQNTPS